MCRRAAVHCEGPIVLLRGNGPYAGAVGGACLLRENALRKESVRHAVRGVVHKNVHRTERGLGLVEYPGYRRRVGQVRLQHLGSSPLPGDAGQHLVCGHRLPGAVQNLPRTARSLHRQPQVGDEHRRTLRGQGSGGRRPNTVVGAGHHRDPTSESCIDHPEISSRKRRSRAPWPSHLQMPPRRMVTVSDTRRFRCSLPFAEARRGDIFRRTRLQTALGVRTSLAWRHCRY
jgi:hypothetical protein